MRCDGARLLLLGDLSLELDAGEEQGFEFVEPMELTELMGTELSVSIWNPECAQAFAPVSLLGVAVPDRNLYVPVPALSELVGPRFEWLDEKQFVIQATPEEELGNLVERLARVAVDPYEGLRGKAKRWWQFWK